jgi:hypothetical protein
MPCGAIAAHQLSILGQYQGPRDKPLKLDKRREANVFANEKRLAIRSGADEGR